MYEKIIIYYIFFNGRPVIDARSAIKKYLLTY